MEDEADADADADAEAAAAAAPKRCVRGNVVLVLFPEPRNGVGPWPPRGAEGGPLKAPPREGEPYSEARRGAAGGPE